MPKKRPNMLCGGPGMDPRPAEFRGKEVAKIAVGDGEKDRADRVASLERSMHDLEEKNGALSPLAETLFFRALPD